MILEPNLIILGVAVVVGAVTLAAVVTGRIGPRSQPGRSSGLGGVVDRSIGMYVLRRLAGRPTMVPPTDAAAPAQGGDAAPPRERAAPIRARTEVYGRPVGAHGSVPRTRPPMSGSRLPRRQLVRDAGVALAALVAVALVAVAVWPGGGTPPAGGVLGVMRTDVPEEPSTGLRSTGSPSVADPSGASDAAPSPPTPEAVPTTASTRPVTTGAPAPTPRPDPVASPTRTPIPTTTASPGATAGPTATPPATAGPTATLPATPEPTPPATPEPTPQATPEPTPQPTPTPLPDPVAAFSCSVDGLTLTCDGSGSTDAAAHSWTFGDGEAASGAEPSHTYAAPGTYTVELTVTNASGSDSRTQDYALG